MADQIDVSMAARLFARALTLIVIGVFIVVALGAMLVWQQFRLRQIADQNRANGRVLVECTTPGPRAPTADNLSTGHPCFDLGTQRTQDAVQQIVTALSKGSQP